MNEFCYYKETVINHANTYHVKMVINYAAWKAEAARMIANTKRKTEPFPGNFNVACKNIYNHKTCLKNLKSPLTTFVFYISQPSLFVKQEIRGVSVSQQKTEFF